MIFERLAKILLPLRGMSHRRYDQLTSEGLNQINLEYLNYTSKGIQCRITFSLIINIFIYFSGLGNS